MSKLISNSGLRGVHKSAQSALKMPEVMERGTRTGLCSIRIGNSGSLTLSCRAVLKERPELC